MVQLVQERSEGGYLVIQEDIRNITIDFDLFANFTIGVNLTGAAINEANDRADLEGYIDAYYCNGDDEKMKELQAGTKLQPNEEMGIYIICGLTDIEIKEITLMVRAVLMLCFVFSPYLFDNVYLILFVCSVCRLLQELLLGELKMN